jgi:hypothetical protein
MNSYNEKSHYGDEPPAGGFVRAFDAFRTDIQPSCPSNPTSNPTSNLSYYTSSSLL